MELAIHCLLVICLLWSMSIKKKCDEIESKLDDVLMSRKEGTESYYRVKTEMLLGFQKKQKKAKRAYERYNDKALKAKHVLDTYEAEINLLKGEPNGQDIKE